MSIARNIDESLKKKQQIIEKDFQHKSSILREKYAKLADREKGIRHFLHEKAEQIRYLLAWRSGALGGLIEQKNRLLYESAVFFLGPNSVPAFYLLVIEANMKEVERKFQADLLPLKKSHDSFLDEIRGIRKALACESREMWNLTAQKDYALEALAIVHKEKYGCSDNKNSFFTNQSTQKNNVSSAPSIPDNDVEMSLPLPCKSN